MIPVSRPTLPALEEFLPFLEDIWKSRMLSNFGKHAQAFEQIAQAYLGNPFVRAVGNCDLGLVMALAALELPEGSECLVQSFTFNSTVNAILWNRLKPVFVDIDAHTFNVDGDDLERRAGSARAILVTHIFGSALDLDRVMTLARAADIAVVVDAAHAYGATFRGTPIGAPRLGDFQVFSFSGTKQVTSGEGGLVAAATAEQANRIEHLRAYGFQNDYVSQVVGLNGKLSEIHAALASLSVREIDDVVASRGSKAERYRRNLREVPGLRFQDHLPECRPTYKDFAIWCPDRRDALADFLSVNGVQTKKYFRPLHPMPAFRVFQSRDDDLADTTAVSERVLCLPMFNDLSDSDIDRVSELVRGFYEVG